MADDQSHVGNIAYIGDLFFIVSNQCLLICSELRELAREVHRFSTNDCRGSSPRMRLLLVDCHSEADVDVWIATLASTSSQLDEKVADLL